MDLKHIVITLVAMLSLFAYYNINDIKLKNVYLRQNLVSASDTIKIIKSKSNNDINIITSNMKSIKDLKNTNDSLYNEIINLGIKPDAITVIKYRYIMDTIKVRSIDTVYIKNNKANLFFHYDSSNIKFNALVNFSVLDSSIFNSTLKINDLEIKLDLITGTFTEDNLTKFFVTSNNPNIKVDTLFGNVNPIIKKSTFGVVIGPSVGIDLLNKDISVGFSVTGGYLFNF